MRLCVVYCWQSFLLAIASNHFTCNQRIRKCGPSTPNKRKPREFYLPSACYNNRNYHSFRMSNLNPDLCLEDKTQRSLKTAVSVSIPHQLDYKLFLPACGPITWYRFSSLTTHRHESVSTSHDINLQCASLIMFRLPSSSVALYILLPGSFFDESSWVNAKMADQNFETHWFPVKFQATFLSYQWRW